MIMSWAYLRKVGKYDVEAYYPFVVGPGATPSDYRLSIDGMVVDGSVMPELGQVILMAESFSGLLVNERPSNPKDAIGSDKLPLHLWPTTATAMGCVGMMEGLSKYGRNSFREHGVRASVYVAACKRHLDAWFEGEDCAPDSGVPHLANALSCIAIIVDAGAAGKLNDDRNYRGEGYRALVEELTPHIRRLREMHKDKDPIHYTIGYQENERS